MGECLRQQLADGFGRGDAGSLGLPAKRFMDGCWNQDLGQALRFAEACHQNRARGLDGAASGSVLSSAPARRIAFLRWRSRSRSANAFSIFRKNACAAGDTATDPDTAALIHMAGVSANDGSKASNDGRP